MSASAYTICKIRISAHPLMIEIGRYKNLETEERLSKLSITRVRVRVRVRMNIIFQTIAPYMIVVERFVFRKFQKYVQISIICQINQNDIIYLPMKIFQ
jgi:hypothetical protein